MKILLDTNIILDYLSINVGFTGDAVEVFNLSSKREDVKFVSSSSITDIMYIISKRIKDKNVVKNKYKEFRSKVNILTVTQDDIDKAFSRDWKDFEDAVQYTVAESNGVDCIITRNKSDFEEQSIPCYEPKEFLKLFNN